MKQKSNQSLNILLESELNTNELTITDIKNDIKKCNRMIKRATYKSMLYKRKLATITRMPNDKTSLIQKGLSLLNITKKYNKTV
tara:strand:+ start:923 stop:1174 length:252 start_codon:yes stop_codon:yes gene_type:complete